MGGGAFDMGGGAFDMGGLMGGGALDMGGGAFVMGGLLRGRQLVRRGGVAHGWGDRQGLRLRPPRLARFARAGTDIRAGAEGDREKPVGGEGRLRAAVALRFFPDAPDPGPRLLDVADAVEQVGHQRIPADAPAAEIGLGHARGQTAGADDLQAVRVHLDEDIGALEEPVPVRHGVRDRLPHRFPRVLGDLLPLEPFDPVGGPRVAVDEPHRALDIADDPSTVVAAVEHVGPVPALRQDAGEVGVREELSRIPGEEEDPGVAEPQRVPGAFRHSEVHQHLFDDRFAGEVGQLEPGVESFAVEVVRVPEARARGEVEPDRALRAEEVADFPLGEFLGDRALPREEPVGALDRLVLALPDMDHDDAIDRLHDDLHRRIAVAGEVLDAGAKGVRVLDADDGPGVVHSHEDLPPGRVREARELARQGLGDALLEFDRRALPLTDQEVDIGSGHAFGVGTENRRARVGGSGAPGILARTAGTGAADTSAPHPRQ